MAGLVIWCQNVVNSLPKLQALQKAGTVIVCIDRDVPGLERYLRDSIAGQPELAFAALVRGDGIIVLHSTPGMVGQVLVDLNVPDVQVLQTRVPQYGNLHLVVRRMTRPDISGQRLYAVVGAYSPIVDPPWLPWLPVGGVLILALLLLVLLQVFIRRAVLKPLEQLAEVAAIVGAGDLSYEIGIRRGVGFRQQVLRHEDEEAEGQDLQPTDDAALSSARSAHRGAESFGMSD